MSRTNIPWKWWSQTFSNFPNIDFKIILCLTYIGKLLVSLENNIWLMEYFKLLVTNKLKWMFLPCINTCHHYRILPSQNQGQIWEFLTKSNKPVTYNTNVSDRLQSLCLVITQHQLIVQKTLCPSWGVSQTITKLGQKRIIYP